MMTTGELIRQDISIARRMTAAARDGDTAAMKALITERKAVRQAIEARKAAESN